MKDYAASPDCRMAYIRSTLDDPSPPRCGRCDNCNGSVADVALPKERIIEAVEFIRRRPVEIAPRLKWVGGGRTGRIAPEQCLQPGRALAYLSDPGWGRDLLQAKHAGRHVDVSMVEAAAALIEKWLDHEPQLTVVFVPNADPARSLVPDFARRLADMLKIPISSCVEKVTATQPQKLMENSVQQFMNVHGAYRVVGPTPTGPVLLVDDVSDSRWTMTVIGALLAEAGVGPVHPFAIAKTKG